ncbi:ISL3 family transposase [Anaerobiospirillum sp. NML120448]|uniref:ISL3 family transposase n=1 Tax=Anaerobiospirillum sp. NML120448 TaxID=2932816 RepID=UPI001FF0FCF3|nr:ISL3 family transposase [Anaerobiospirillum sp. NML120448]MCK0515546.1 ISL3 family transposase [Anaerobiospirillum sp. NML120448]
MINNTPYQLNQQTNYITLEELYGLNVPGVHVTKVIPRRENPNSDELTGVLVEVEQTPPNVCPYCGNSDSAFHRHFTTMRRFKHPDLCGTPTAVLFHSVRYKCSKCSRTFTPKALIENKHSMLTGAMAKAIIKTHTDQQCITYRRAARFLGVSDYHVKRVIEDHCDKERNLTQEDINPIKEPKKICDSDTCANSTPSSNLVREEEPKESCDSDICANSSPSSNLVREEEPKESCDSDICANSSPSSNLVREEEPEQNVSSLSSDIPNVSEKKTWKCNFVVPDYTIRRIWIDEISMHHRHYLTFIYDVDHYDLLFVTEKNNKNAIKSFFEWGKEKIAPDLSIACDMNAPYLSAFTEVLPNCKITFDRFHIIGHVIHDLTECCKAVVSLLPDNSKAKALFNNETKDAFRIFFSRGKNLKKGERAKLNLLLKSHPDIKAFHDIYKDILACYDNAKSYTDFRQQILIICQNMLKIEVNSEVFTACKKDKSLFKACCYEFELDNIPRILSNQGYDDEAIHQLINNNQVGESKITKMVRRFIKHLPNIARFAESKLTTGPIEGRNNLVKLIKKAKFGIKNLDSFVNVVRLRIRQEYSRNLKTKWP